MMGFLAPWFLTAMAAVGLPVYIHLLRRHTTTPKPVSSLMFFERGTQSSTRHRRLRYLLLFTLRALLLVLLALAFASPFIRRASAAASDRLLVIVIDNSFSMRAETRLEDAKREALALLATRSPSQRAQVMVLGAELQVLTQPIQDANALRSVVEGIHAGDSHGSFGELGRGMRTLAETVHGPIDLYLFSDMQASNMPGNFADMVVPGNVSLVLHPVAKTVLPNWTVESVEAPAQLVDPKKAHVIAVIAGHHTPPARRTVSLVINGVVSATREVNVPADGRATVTFDSLDVPYGASRDEVRIDAADAFASDNNLRFAVKRADPERVLFVHQPSDSRSSLYFSAALAAAAPGAFVVQSIDVNQAADVDPTMYAFVVLSDVESIPSILENSLRHDVESGGGVFIAAGMSTGRRQRIPLFGEPVKAPRFYSQDTGYSSIGRVDDASPIMKDSGAWSEAKIFYASEVEPGPAHVAVRLADGTPFLMDKGVGQGHIVLLASGIGNISNNLPLQPSFVPFVDHLSRYLSGSERLTGTRVVDSFVQLRSPASEGAAESSTVDVVGPDGARPLTLQEEATAQTLRLTQAGFYQIRYPSGRDALLAVNPDPRESDLQMIPDDVLRLWSGSTRDTGQTKSVPGPDTESKTSVYKVWWWVMLLILIAAVAESVVGSRYLGTQREEI
jgi:hypothetical protein